jgi:hypothetical protein
MNRLKKLMFAYHVALANVAGLLSIKHMHKALKSHPEPTEALKAHYIYWFAWLKTSQGALAPLVDDLAEQPVVSADDGVYSMDWSGTPTSKAVAKAAFPSLLTKSQLERLH